MIKRILTSLTHKIYSLPVLVLMPHSRCNCRCVMCDIWKANSEKREISAEELQQHISSFQKLGVKRVALSGGEALMHSNLWAFCEALRNIGVKISLLSTGISLKAHASHVIQYCNDVIISLDGSPAIHNHIRNIPGAFEKLEEGVRALKKLNPSFRVTGRSVIQKWNYYDFNNILLTAQNLGLDQISFLPADISSSAFNRANPWQDEKVMEVALTKQEADELEEIVTNSFKHFEKLYASKFIAESPQKIIQLVEHYRAVLGLCDFPGKRCNAPWVSAVIEPDGAVRPCFFHASYGNIFAHSFEEIINSKSAVQFRKNLDMKNDATCSRCVCSLHLGITASP